MDLGSFTATVTLKICCKEATSAQYVQKEQLYLLHVPTTFALFSPKKAGNIIRRQVPQMLQFTITRRNCRNGFEEAKAMRSSSYPSLKG
ncbi:Endoplasmic Reticulum Resident Protein 44 [Manis pentadactyla]|nr:Endoplasmic Reticulum Resident Protein 44 [Manis pentadactyla]